MSCVHTMWVTLAVSGIGLLASYAFFRLLGSSAFSSVEVEMMEQRELSLFLLSALVFAVCFTAFFCYVVDRMADPITRLLMTLRLTPMTILIPANGRLLGH